MQKESLKLIRNSKKNLRILELGCGNGNITKFLIKSQKGKKHSYFLSDISYEAVKAAKKNIDYKKVKFKTGSMYNPWKNYKFDLIISDVSSISDNVAKHSDWYKDVVCNSGIDGLKNIEKIINNSKTYLNRDGKLLFPIISLCDVKKLKLITEKNFKIIKYSKKNMWPLPKFFNNRYKIFLKLKDKNFIEFEDKFGIYIAFTHTAICQKTF